VERLSDLDIAPYGEIAVRLERFRYIRPVATWLRENLAITADQVQQWLVSGAQGLLKHVVTTSGNVVLGVVGTLVGIFLMQFLLFFMLRDGRAAFDRLCKLVPLEPASGDMLVERLASVARAVVFGTVVTALVQGLLVGIGFAVVRLPSPIVFGVAGTVAAFIPAGGTGLVLVPAVIYLFASGQTGAAIFLLLWTAVVGVADNFLRPLLAARHAPVQTWAVFVGVIGGISMFGFLGVVLGPVLLSLIVELLKLAEDAVTRRA
jgi:predicted PurR-regulated permease PerM